jgi:phosphoglycolate phosphatase
MQSLQLIIFDLDGTLIDSSHDLTDAVNHAIAPLGKPPLAYDELPALLGSGLTHLLEVTANIGDEETMKTTKARFDEYYEDNFANNTQLYPGVHSTLEQLSKDYKLAIYSNKLQYFTSRIAEALQIAPFFAKVQGAATEMYPLKPHPAGVTHILTELNTEASRTLMVGDSTHDIEAAQSAGVKSCAVTYGYRHAEVLKAVKPDYIIGQFDELIPIIDDLKGPAQTE